MNNHNTQSIDEEPLPAYAPLAYPPPPTDPQPSTSQSRADTTAPPAWETAAGEAAVARLYPYGVYHDAGQNNYERGVRFVHMHPDIDPAQFIPFQTLDLVRTQGPGAWTLTLPSQFDGKLSRNRSGTTEVKSNFTSETDKTVLSSLPLLWGKYSQPETSKGVYYEVFFDKVGRDATIAVGLGCLPYPTDFRLPGWHRQSAAVHSDDGHKFYENGDGGVPFTGPIKKGDVLGVGIYYPHVNPTGAIFYTKNGRRIPEDAFRGAFFPRNRYDVFAMIGLSGEAKVTVNFGQEKFKWHEGNETGWKLGQENFEKPRLE